MTTCVIRTCIIYILLILAIRMTGKRQIGELEISELVSTILISEIAATPISNQEIPLSFAIIPILLIVSLEVVISYLSMRSTILKKIFIGTPSVLIRRGEIQPKELSKARMSLEELLCQLRENGITTIEDVNYAILENDGKLSVIPHESAQPATKADINADIQEVGIAHAVVIDGAIKKEALAGSGKDQAWLDKEIRKSKLRLQDIFLLSVDDADHVYIIRKKNAQ